MEKVAYVQFLVRAECAALNAIHFSTCPIVMKKRWRRRTPIGILTDDELDEADRSYSRLSRPRTNQVLSHGLESLLCRRRLDDSPVGHAGREMCLSDTHGNAHKNLETLVCADCDAKGCVVQNTLVCVSNKCLHPPPMCR